jgi:hypothetical protein
MANAERLQVLPLRQLNAHEMLVWPWCSGGAIAKAAKGAHPEIVSSSTMRMELSRPFVESLTGKREYFSRERPR